MSLRWLAIVNAHAGHSRSAHWQTSMAERLRCELNARVVFTEYRGHASELARTAVEEGLAVFGGDGTVAEAVNGMDLRRQRLLLLPGGTGNGLARDLHLNSLEAAFAAAHAPGSTRLDLMHARFETNGTTYSRLAISTASVGYAAEVVKLADRYFKRLGSWCYPLAASLQAARQGSFPAEVSIDGNKHLEGRLSNLMVNNTRHAGNFSAFRGSKLGDGHLEILLARADPLQQMLHNVAVLTKTYFYQTAAEIPAHQLELTLPFPQRLMIDGELWEDVRELKLEVLPECLQCVA